VSQQNVCLEWLMTLIKHIPQHNVVFLQQLSHLSWGRMQQLTNIRDIIDGVAENIQALWVQLAAFLF
jgi:hypothetical protein